MIIKSIELNDFRNYHDLKIEVSPSINIFYGSNAQGKTNIVEAINVCSCLSSHRTSKDSDMIPFGMDNYSIAMNCLDKDGYETKLSVDYSLNNAPNRKIAQDNIKLSRISEFLGICNTVIFAPEDLSLIKGAPSVRRRFFNLLISKSIPSYTKLLHTFNHILMQRNKTLKDIKFNNSADVNMLLDYWDYPLAEVSSEIIIVRYRFALLLSEYAHKHHLIISSDKEDLQIRYDTISGVSEALEAFVKDEDILSRFISGTASTAILEGIKANVHDIVLSRLTKNRQNDIEHGITMSGIHKDELDITLNGLSMKNFSSQGQQRSASLSIKLAELEILRQITSTSPILLLDDVFSELDINRRVALLSGMVDAQIFITCTDRSYIEKEIKQLLKTNEEPKFFKIEAGKVYPDC